MNVLKFIKTIISCSAILCVLASALATFSVAKQVKASATESVGLKKTSPEQSYIQTLPAHLRQLGEFDTSPKDNPVTNSGAKLGRFLFYERALSKNNLVSCGSCHSQEIGFDDPNRFSIGFEGKITRRHSVGLANARFNGSGRYLRDERMATLEDQVLDPIFDPLEMGLAKGEAVETISALPRYSSLFADAFGDDTVTRERIAKALAQFVRSMVSTSSKFDQARAKHENNLTDFKQFSASENRGKTLFFTTIEKGGAGCFLCHQTEAFVMLKRHNNGLDLGTKDKRDETLKGVSLKNIAIRAPHMMDGRFETLGEVIDHYSNGIKNNPALSTELKTKSGAIKNANLVEKDKQALLDFLATLTDGQFLKDEKFSNPFFERK